MAYRLTLQRSLYRYAAAAGITLACAMLQWSLRPWLHDRAPFLLFLAALTFAAALLGRGPAAMVLAGGALNAVLWLDPLGRWSLEHPEDRIALLLFLAVGAVLLIYQGRLRVASKRADTAEDRLLLAQEDTGLGVFELDFQSDTAFVSAGMCRVLGQPILHGPIPLGEWLARLSPEHVEDSRRTLQQKVDRGELSYEREHRVLRADGGTQWLQTRVRIDVTADHRLARARGVAMDVTKRKEVEELLESTQVELRRQLQDLQRLHALSQKLMPGGGDLPLALRAVLELMVDLHGAKMGLLWVCAEGTAPPEVVAHVGLDEAALLDLARLPEGLGTHVQVIAERRRIVVADAAADGQPPAVRALASQAGYRGVHGAPLFGSDGQVIGVFSVMLPQARAPDAREMRLADICAATAAAVIERERARRTAAESQKRFAVALDTSTVPFNILIPVRDHAGAVIDFEWDYVNPAATRAIGLDVAALSGHRIGPTLPGTWDQPGLLEKYVAVVDSCEPCEFELHLQRAEVDRWYQVIASPLLGSVAVWFADITARKRNEQALVLADRRKDEFLATLAHELRNPLAPIRQAAWIARAAASTAAEKAWSLDMIERQVQRMALLLDDLFDVSRITRGALLLKKSRVALAAVIDAAVETARPHIEDKGHRLSLQLPDTPVTLDVDPLRLSQVLGNLLVNAAKYTDSGGLIRLVARCDAAGCTISVADSGVGLAPEHLQSVFEMFAQMPGTDLRSQNGLGIGLALARGLVQLHGGSIEAASAGRGRGSEFTVQLPPMCLCEATGPEPALPATMARAAAPKPAVRILIADDNADAADSLAELLRLQGHSLQVVYDGEDALAAFHRFEPHVALLDMGMPRLSGLEVVRAIRQLPAGRRTVLIAVTGWGNERDRRAALDAGFDHHTVKPVDPVRLQQLIGADFGLD
jgi:signal transduction histidine kinase